ncbi:hypothetical protein [Streptosporangium saharense]|uniref:Tat pathway signal sequence domain protein n=1 Tax=Streptosporangium saharense TaxID=1706840 RepID=A0A7W7QIH9_9ACTN|nr:hypothetical protein [Streptosporangium saharense]MBB4914227.1 hypothetical protein [Streptosporangium saharense]
MRTRVITSTLAGAALIAAALPSPATASTADRSGTARASVGYNVVIAGTVSGRSFRRSATLVLRSTVTRVTTNGVNPVDVCLKSGFPGGAPQVGAIWYGSNSACFRSTAALDMTYVRTNGNTATVSPDSRISASGSNNFTATGSLTSCIYFPTEGGASYTFHNDGTVSGRISIRGFGGYPCGYSTYNATLSGRRG